ncbi:MAG: glycoside hydrolase family 2 protein [Actinomycetota bacterium]|nr:glycoside hydrolase family 2 protein [Actinomycetota bacterium]
MNTQGKTRLYMFLITIIVLIIIFSTVGCRITMSAEETAVPGEIPVSKVESIELSQGWALISAEEVADEDATISQVGYDVSSWYPTNVPSTILAALAANGVYKDGEGEDSLYFGTNLNSVPILTGKNWWYRTEFAAPAGSSGQQYWLRFKGIAYSGQIWLNGKLLDENAEGTMVNHDYNVTGLIQPGKTNALAVMVTPPVENDLTFWYVDWNPAPKDMNGGLWGKVILDMAGPVALRDPFVKTVLPLPDTDSADLTVYVDAVNGSVNPVTGVLKGEITKEGYPTISFQQDVTLDPNERREIVFDPETFTQLHISDPALWWPYNMGDPELYNLDICFELDDIKSDAKSIKFGIRQITDYMTSPIYGDSYVGFKINGQDILIRGAAYVWDMLMRWGTAVNEKHMRYFKDMNINTIRFEGILGNKEIYDIADREGMLLMPGFVCCSKWENWDEWTSAEHGVALASLESQMRLMRHHASALVWTYASDGDPPSSILTAYRDIAEKLHWQNPARSSTSGGQSGIKMNGPYKWVPPNYWYYDTKSGGAFGFCAEQGGETPPPEDSLRKFIPEKELWPISFVRDTSWKFHAGTSWSTFKDINVYNNAMNKRYGKPNNITEYSDRSQLMNYEQVRSQFEAYAANAYTLATGTIFWMGNSAWPALTWELYDYYMKPAGSFFGAKKALEPVHILWDYNTTPENTSITPNKVKVFNSTLNDYSNMTAYVSVYNIPDLTQQYAEQVTLDVLSANACTEVLTIPSITGLSNTYFLRLQLKDSSGDLVSSNLYWYSTQQDILSDNIRWYMRDVTDYADLTGLNLLETNNNVTAVAFKEVRDGNETATISVSNTSMNNIAFFVHVEVVRGEDGHKEVLPVTYTDNYVTLWPGESVTIKAEYETADLGGQPAYFMVRGYNVPEFSNEIALSQDSD